MRSTKPKLSEADLQKFGTDLLQADGWRPLRTDPVSRREWGKGFGEKGMPDYLYLRYGQIETEEQVPPCIRAVDYEDGHVLFADETLWIEWKRKGSKAEAHQKAWHAAERARGALVWVAGEDFEATPEAFKAFYLASGLNRAIRP